MAIIIRSNKTTGTTITTVFVSGAAGFSVLCGGVTVATCELTIVAYFAFFSYVVDGVAFKVWSETEKIDSFTSTVFSKSQDDLHLYNSLAANVL